MPDEDIVEANCDPCDCNLHCNQGRGASKDHRLQQPLRERVQKLRHNIVVLRMMSRPVTKAFCAWQSP